MIAGVQVWLGLATLGAVAAQLVPPASRVWTWLGMGMAVAAGAAARLTGRASRRRGELSRVATVLAAAGVCWGAAALGQLRLQAIARPVLPARHVAQLTLPHRGVVVGSVRGLPVRHQGRTVVVLEATRVDDLPVEGRIRVSISARLRKLRPGDRLTLQATLRRPRGFANPGSFDLVGYLARRGIHVIGNASRTAPVLRCSRPAGTIGVRLARWRQRLVRAIARAVPGTEGAVLAALVVGDQQAIPTALREAFARTGVVHVLSVSGLHVAVVATVVFGLSRWMLAWSTWVVRALDLRALAAAATVVPVAAYAALAGFEVATVRAALMAAAGACATIAARPVDVLRTLALAALVLALAWPGAPQEISFQLSFASVLAIVLAVRRLAPEPVIGWQSRLRLAAIVSLAAALGTAPIGALHFNQVSLIGPVVNPLVIPLFGAVVVVLGLGAAAIEPFVPSVAAFGFSLAGGLLRPGIAVVEWLGGWAGAALRVPAPSPFELCLLAVLFLAPLTLRGRLLRLALGIGVFGLVLDVGSWIHERQASARLRVTFLDVGQGDAAVAELPGGAVLVIDGGGFPGSDFDTGAAVVLPFLATRKILRVDAVVMSHPHPDHFAGLASLLPHARELWWSGRPGIGAQWSRFETALQRHRGTQRVLTAGLVLPGFARSVRVLHPPATWRAPGVNDGSIVLALDVGATSVLLTGDIEARAEAALLGSGVGLAPAAVLKVPHHGSRTSSGTAWLARVRPAVAVISVGADNTYGLPAPEVEQRYRKAGACVLRTDRCGAITVESDGTGFRVESWLGCTCPARVRPRD